MCFPAAPLSRIDVLNARIASRSLSVAEQEDIVSQLEEAVSASRDPHLRKTVGGMLGKLAARPDLVLVMARRIEQLQMQLREPRAGFPPPITPPSDAGIQPFPSAPPITAGTGAPLPGTPPDDQALARKRKKPCGQPGDPVSRAVRAAVKPGLLMFNPPDEMTQGKKERIEVGIARSPELRQALAAGLRGHGKPQFEAVDTSSVMGVELKGSSFDITPFSPAEQLVTPKARWEFDVRPNRAGQQTLTLCVSLRVDSPAATGGRIGIPVLERDIRIRVDIGFSTRRFVASNWQWLVTAVVGLGGALVAWITLFHSLFQFRSCCCYSLRQGQSVSASVPAKMPRYLPCRCKVACRSG